MRELDLLKYQNSEIEAAHLKNGEEEELESKRSVILNSEKITNSLLEASMQIGEASIDSISSAVRALEKISELDSKYDSSLNTLKSIYYDLQELSRDITILKEEIEFDEEQRQTIEAKIDFPLLRETKQISLEDEDIKITGKIENLDFECR